MNVKKFILWTSNIFLSKINKTFKEYNTYQHLQETKVQLRELLKL